MRVRLLDFGPKSFVGKPLRVKPDGSRNLRNLVGDVIYRQLKSERARRAYDMRERHFSVSWRRTLISAWKWELSSVIIWSNTIRPILQALMLKANNRALFCPSV
jgi:hypothetical protein